VSGVDALEEFGSPADPGVVAIWCMAIPCRTITERERSVERVERATDEAL
jgi:hypothetical protein